MGYIIIFIVIIFYILFLKKKDEKVKWDYDDNGRKCIVKGNREKFRIKVDNRFEFLVEDGVIVACKDKKRFRRFIYYREDKSGNN